MLVDLDKNLIAEAFYYAKVDSENELIELPLREFIRNHRPRDVRELQNKITIDPDYNHKNLRD